MAALSRTARILLIAVAGTLVLGVTGVLAFLTLGPPVIDEWACSQGEAPVITRDGGSYCAPEGADLPRGDRFDPLGNRPFDCSPMLDWFRDTRPGFQRVEEIATGDLECMSDDRPIPEGYRAA